MAKPEERPVGKRRPKVVGLDRDESPAGPAKKAPPKIRVVSTREGERLTTPEWRRRFARNLDRLMEIVGLSRKEAAKESGIDYRMVRRLVSEGVSRGDERSKDELQKLVAFFCLERADDLWRADLLPLLLTTEYGAKFVEKFRPRLLAVRERKLTETLEPPYDPLALLNAALGFEAGESRHAKPDQRQRKLSAILTSPKAEQFDRLIDDYYEFARSAAKERA